MKILIPIILFLLLTGCGTTHHVDYAGTSLGTVSRSVDVANDGIDRVFKSAGEVLKTGSAPNDLRISGMMNDIKSVKSSLSSAKGEIVLKQNEINGMARQMNEIIERLNYIEPKYASSVGLIWKWRLIAIGSWVTVVGLFVFRIWAKTNLPFLAKFL